MKEKRTFSSFGFPTILITFVMICILTFSVLTLITANSDWKLTQKVAEKTTAYYETENNLLSHIELVDNELYNLYMETQNSGTFLSDANTIITNTSCDSSFEHSYQMEEHEDYLTVKYSFPMTETQTLEAEIKISYPSNSTQSFIEIMSWKTRSETSTIDGNSNLNVIGN